jgi:hypothetical protein
MVLHEFTNRSKNENGLIVLNVDAWKPVMAVKALKK